MKLGFCRCRTEPESHHLSASKPRQDTNTDTFERLVSIWAAIPFNIFEASPPHVIAIVLGKGDRSVLQIVLDLFRLSTEKTQLFPCSSGKKVLDCEESVRWRTSLKLPPQDLRGTRNPSSAVLSRIREAKVHTLDAESACNETLNMKRKYSWLTPGKHFLS